MRVRLQELLIDLKNSINSKNVLENENPKKRVRIVERILDFNKQEKIKGIKMLTPKQMLQRLPMSLAQLKAGNTSKNILIEIRQIIYFLYREKKLLKKL